MELLRVDFDCILKLKNGLLVQHTVDLLICMTSFTLARYCCLSLRSPKIFTLRVLRRLLRLSRDKILNGVGVRPNIEKVALLLIHH